MKVYLLRKINFSLLEKIFTFETTNELLNNLETYDNENTMIQNLWDREKQF